MRGRKLQTALTLLIVGFAASFALAQEPGSRPEIVKSITGAAKGTWRLNTEKSDFGQMPKPKSMQLVVIEDSDKAVKWRLTGTGADGTPIQESFEGAADGKPYPVIGDPNVSTVAYTRNGDMVDSTVTRKDGGTIKEVITMSDDKNTMTLKAEGAGSTGLVNFTEVWDRIGGSAKRSGGKKSAQ